MWTRSTPAGSAVIITVVKARRIKYLSRQGVDEAL